MRPCLFFEAASHKQGTFRTSRSSQSADPTRTERSLGFEELQGVCCAKNVFAEHGAVPEMKEGPSEPACRSRLQTAVSCFSPKGCGGERYGQKA